MNTEYEVRNRGLKVPGLHCGKVLWGNVTYRLGSFKEALAILESVPKFRRGVTSVHIRRLKPTPEEIEELPITELRALCKAEGLLQLGNRKALIKRLTEKEVRT